MNDSESVRHQDLNRRSFIRRVWAGGLISVGAVAAGLGLKSKSPPIRSTAEEEDKGEKRQRGVVNPGKIAVAKGEDPAKGTKKAINALGGMESFISKGDVVLLKPNIGWDRRPKQAANTNPDVVAEVARLCLEAGAKKVRVTDSPCNNPTRCFDKSGMKKSLAKMPEVELYIPTERDYVEKDLGGEAMKSWPVLKALFECHKIINIPIAKHHSSAVLSLGMKNWYGILGGGSKRGQLHQQMALCIAEMARFVAPDLTVLDAYRILHRNGPQGGSVRDTRLEKTIMASTDPVAIDALGATLFGLKPTDPPFVPIAQKMGLGVSDINAMEILGDWEVK